MKKSILTIVPFLFLLNALAQVNGTFIDERDNHKYKWVQIGTQIWMAENLAYLPSVNSWRGDMSDTEPRYYVHGYDGTDVQEAKNHFKKFFEEAMTPKWKFVVQDSVTRTEKSLPPTPIEFNIYYYFGVLYNWPAAMGDSVNRISSTSKVQGICPCGWHLPSDKEWNELEKKLGAGSAVEKEKIIRRGVVGELLKGRIDSINLEKVRYEWENLTLISSENFVWKISVKEKKEFEEAIKKEINQRFWRQSDKINHSGFSAFPGGFKMSSIRVSIGGAADFWSSTDANKGKAWNREISEGFPGVFRIEHKKENGFSIRCIKD